MAVFSRLIGANVFTEGGRNGFFGFEKLKGSKNLTMRQRMTDQRSFARRNRTSLFHLSA